VPLAEARSLDKQHGATPQPTTDITRWPEFVAQGLSGGDGQLYELALAEMEQCLLPLVMARSGASQVKAAQALGITRGSLRKKLRLHGLLAAAPATDFESASSQTVER
jgi:DNA-binding protein Fis